MDSRAIVIVKAPPSKDDFAKLMAQALPKMAS